MLNFFLERLGSPASNFFFWYLDREWRNLLVVEFTLKIISVAVVLLLVTLLGYASRFLLGRIILNGFENLLARVPFISTVYRTVKQIVNTFSKEKKAVFQEVVILEYPRKRCYVLGFITSHAKGETQEATKEKIINVFVPTTPNPTSGFLLMLPEEDIVRLEMSISDGMKWIISGGAVVPDPKTGKSIRIDNPSISEPIISDKDD